MKKAKKSGKNSIYSRRHQPDSGPKMPIRLFFVIFIVLDLLLINAIAAILIGLLGYYAPVIYKIPGVVWLIVTSAILGIAVSTLMAKFLFDPIMKLRSAMGRVTQGDFDVQLQSDHMFPEIRQINQDFNAMTQELSSTEILKTEFISNVSHEFKTPINAIEGYATLLQGVDPANPEEQNIYIEKILFNTHRLSKLVGNILLLSKVDNQGIQIHVATYRLDEQIRQCLLALEPKWTQNENEFEVDLDRVDYTGNENLLIHVWNNLIENAIKYGPKGGLISMMLRQQADRVVFTIEDQGPGIPQEALQHIFDRFYQADSSRKAEGNGLGLALVKQILNISDGSIQAENLPERGTRFTVTLKI